MASKTKFVIGKGLREAISKIIKTNRDEIQDPRIMRALGNEAARLMVRRTRLGFGVSKDGAKRNKLTPLSPQYIQTKREKFSGLSSLTRPKKSNLTRTNQMLTSIKVIDSMRGRVSVGATGNRHDSDLTNEDVVRFNQVTGRVLRPFLNLSALEIKGLQRTYTKIIDPAFGKI
jgi:hypothetical protein